MHFVLAVAFAALVLAARAQDSEGVSQAPRLAVILDFAAPCPKDSIETMERELERIMRPTRLQFQWRILDAGTSRESFDNLVVARFRGGCSADALPASRGGLNALGIAHVSDGNILPFAEVDCDRIRKLVAGELARKKAPRARKLFGLALGRVLAHELYHILSRSRDHGRMGLDRAFLSPRDLVSGDAELGRTELEAIRRGVSP